MTVSFVGAQGNAGTTVTIPTHQVGDLILIFAYRDASNTAPSTPAASGTVPTWTLIGSDGANTNSTNFRYAVATATTTTSGTWTNATDLICLVYRGASVGAAAGTGANNTTTINYPALTLQRTDNTSWVVGVAGHKTATNVDLAPGAMVNRISAGSESAGHDTNATVTTWASTNVTVNASSAYRSWVVELRDNSYVLPVDKGTFTLTGNAATLAKGVKLTADKGTFTVTGNAATLLQSHKAIVDAGTFTLTGNDVTLTKGGGVNNPVLTVDTGTYVVTSNGATLTKGYLLTVDKGTFTLTGQPATLSRTYNLPVDKGTYTLTGNDATLNKGSRLLADAGAYAVTGNDAILLRTYRLTTDAGAYVVTGNDAALLHARVLLVDAGSFLLTGQPITTARGYVLPVGKGTYVLTGRPANLGTPAIIVSRYILIT